MRATFLIVGKKGVINKKKRNVRLNSVILDWNPFEDNKNQYEFAFFKIYKDG